MNRFKCVLRLLKGENLLDVLKDMDKADIDKIKTAIRDIDTSLLTTEQKKNLKENKKKL